MTKEERRLKFMKEHPAYKAHWDAVYEEDQRKLKNIEERRKKVQRKLDEKRKEKERKAAIRLRKKEEKEAEKATKRKFVIIQSLKKEKESVKEGYCEFCSMKLTGLHKDTPCVESVVKDLK